jgi:hypothetical protein
MSFRLLIDECLTPELVALAIAAGHVESTCARDRGLLGATDWQLLDYAIRKDFTLVTHNARDFRGAGASGPGGLYSASEIHCGLICLGSEYPMDIERHRTLFAIALGELARLPDLVNQAMEVFEDIDGSVSVAIYDIPKGT